LFLSPGFSFGDLVDRLPDELVRELLGAQTCELIGLLDFDSAEERRFRTVAKLALDPEKLVRDSARRSQLLSFLPDEKREELAQRLSAPEYQSPSLFLSQLEWTTAELRTLLGFLGLVADGAAPVYVPPRTTQQAQYALFPHQRRIAAQARAFLYGGERRGVLHLPTGVGKTRTAMSLICDHLRKREPTTVVWLAHGRELLEQAAVEFEKAWAALGDREVSVTRAWGSNPVQIAPQNDGLIVLGLEKAVALSKGDRTFLDRLGLVTTLTVFDEAHQAIAPTFRAVANALALRRDASLLGLTATPGRTWSDISKDEELATFFAHQKVMLELDGHDNPIEGLIEQGYLARPQFRSVFADAGTPFTAQDQMNLAEAYELPDAVVEAMTGRAQWNLQTVRAVVDLAERHRRILLFAASLEHSRTLVALLSALGLDAEQVTGESSVQHRNRVIGRFKSAGHRPMVLSNFGVLTTGFDAPAASAVVIARPTLSLVLYSQMVGRALRGPKAGGTEECEIVTVLDPGLPGFGDVADAFANWEDVWTKK